MKQSKQQNSIIYRGPSLIDGSPIVVILTGLTGGSSNAKTGSMAQSWILADNGQSPIEASRTGNDYSVCGNCPHRGTVDNAKLTGWSVGRSCYVSLHQAPTAVYNAYKRRAYPLVDREGLRALGAGRAIRVGSYGDPAAVPAIVWRELLAEASGHTAYTHQSGVKNAEVDYGLFMVSADSKRQAQGLHLNGKRTFRVIPVHEWQDKGRSSLLKSEVLCPASTEANRPDVTCVSCGLCNGSSMVKGNGEKRTVQRKSIAIVAHGSSRMSVGKIEGKLVNTNKGNVQ